MAETVAAAVRKVRDELLASFGETHKLQIAREVRRRYPDLVADMGDRLIDQRLSELARISLRETSENQEELPGFPNPMPRTFVVPDGEGDVRHVLVQRSTLADEAADLEVKRLNLVACQGEFNKARGRHERLWSVPGAHADMPTSEAIRLYGET